MGTNTFSGLRKVFDELIEEYVNDIFKYAEKKDRPLTLDSIPAMLSPARTRGSCSRVETSKQSEGTKEEATRKQGSRVRILRTDPKLAVPGQYNAIMQESEQSDQPAERELLRQHIQTVHAGHWRYNLPL